MATRNFRSFSIGARGTKPPEPVTPVVSPGRNRNPFDVVAEPAEEHSSSSQSQEKPDSPKTEKKQFKSSKSNPDIPDVTETESTPEKEKKKKSKGLVTLFKSSKKKKDKDKKDKDKDTMPVSDDNMGTQAIDEESEEKSETSAPPSISPRPIPSWVSPRSHSLASDSSRSPPRPTWLVESSPTIHPRLATTSQPQPIVRSRSGSISSHRSSMSFDSPPKLHIKDALTEILNTTINPPAENVLLQKGDKHSIFIDPPETKELSASTPLPREQSGSVSRGGLIRDSGNGVVIVQLPAGSSSGSGLSPAPPLPFNPDQYDKIQIGDSAKAIQNTAMANALMNVIVEEESTSLLQDIQRNAMTQKIQREAAENNTIALELIARQSDQNSIESIFDKIEAKRTDANEEIIQEQEDNDFIQECQDIVNFMTSDLPDNELALEKIRNVPESAASSDDDSSSSEDQEPSQEDDDETANAPIIINVPRLNLPPTPKPIQEGEDGDDQNFDHDHMIKQSSSKPDPILEKIKQLAAQDSEFESNQKKKKKKRHYHHSSNDNTIRLWIEEQTKVILNTIKAESNHKNSSMLALAKHLYQSNINIKHIEEVQMAQKEILVQQQNQQKQLIEAIRQLTIQLQTKSNGSARSDSITPNDSYAKLEKNYQKITSMLQIMLQTIQTMSETVSKYQLELAVVQRVSNQQQIEYNRMINTFEEKFRTTTSIYDNNRELLNGQIKRLKQDVSQYRDSIITLNTELTNQQQYNIAIMNALKTKGKSIVLQTVEEDGSETSLVSKSKRK